MGELRVGIIGLGSVAAAHIEAFRKVEGAEVVAVCSRRKHEPRELERRFGQPLRVFDDGDAMLADDALDIIDICTPHPLHANQAIAAARAGKHLILEKPISLDWDDALRVRDAVHAAGIRTCVGFECRFSAHFTLVRSVIDQGLLGTVHYAEVDYFHGIGPWYGQFSWNVKRDFGGSSLLTAGCHALDALLFFMQEPVYEVTSYETRSRSPIFEPYEYATTSTTLIRFESGRLAKVASVIDCLQPYYFHVHLVGSEGSLLDNRFTSTRLPGLRRDRWSTLETALVDSGNVSDHPYEPQFQAFVDAIKEEREMPLTSFDEALATHRVLFAADRSAAEGRPVKLEELRE